MIKTCLFQNAEALAHDVSVGVMGKLQACGYMSYLQEILLSNRRKKSVRYFALFKKLNL